MDTNTIIERIDDELVLRRGTPADAEAIARFNGTIHADPGEGFAEFIANWVRELTGGKHPTTSVEDFTLVENTETGEIVSTLCLIDQTWAYEGIPFQVGRPELVGTLEEYRRRSLVRKQFDVVHQWSAERGQVMQIITGIPWFYRQFGYEMAVDLGGRRHGSIVDIPALKEGEEEAYLFRPVEDKDIPFISALYEQGCRRSLLSCLRDEDFWRYDIFVRNPKSDFAHRMEIITTPEGEPVGYLATTHKLYGDRLPLTAFELVEGVSWFEVSMPVLRRLKTIGSEFVERDSTEDKKVVFNKFSVSLGADHPIYHVIPNRMPHVFDPYAYYIRVPDLPGFLRLIAPALEERLAKSYMAGHSGELKLNFFTEGIIMNFEKGKIKSVELWEKPVHDDASAHFPGLTFLQLLFGHRDVQELEDAYADIYFPKEFAKPLLRALFPKKASHVKDLA